MDSPSRLTTRALLSRAMRTTVLPAMALLSMIAYCANAQAGWIIAPPQALDSAGLPQPTSLVWPREHAQGYPTLRAALQKVADEGRLDQLHKMSAHHLLSNDTFQEEIVQQLEVIAPKELKEAMKSAGNLHNPKVNALRTGFEKAVLATPTVMRFKEDLARHQLDITGVSFEKFYLESSEGTKRFSCSMWLILGKASTKAPAP